MGETEQKFEAFLLEKASLSKKNAVSCIDAIKEYLENEKRNFREKTGENSDQPNVMVELVRGLNAQKLREDSPERQRAAKKLEESSKTPLEILKKTFSQILEEFEAIPEGEQKTLLNVYKKHHENLLSDVKEIRKMHNKENIQ